MSLISPEQASFIIGWVQFVFALSLLPTIFNPKAQVPRKTSGLTGGGLWVISLTYLLMGPLWFAVGMSALCAGGWTAIFILRPVRAVPVECCLAQHRYGGTNHNTDCIAKSRAT